MYIGHFQNLTTFLWLTGYRGLFYEKTLENKIKQLKMRMYQWDNVDLQIQVCEFNRISFKTNICLPGNRSILFVNMATCKSILHRDHIFFCHTYYLTKRIKKLATHKHLISLRWYLYFSFTKPIWIQLRKTLLDVMEFLASLGNKMYIMYEKLNLKILKWWWGLDFYFWAVPKE